MPKGGEMRPALFAFIPKTGGSALLGFLQSKGGQTFLHQENNPIAKILKCPTQHFHYELLNAIYDLEKVPFAFTIVRNPFDRARSDYLWGFRNVEDPAKMPSFDQWLHHMIREYHANPYVFDNHIRPQSHFIGPAIRKVYRYEDGLDTIARDIIARMGLDISVDEGSALVPRMNTAQDHHGAGVESAKVKMSDASRTLLKAIYKADFDAFYPDALND